MDADQVSLIHVQASYVVVSICYTRLVTSIWIAAVGLQLLCIANALLV